MKSVALWHRITYAVMACTVATCAGMLGAAEARAEGYGAPRPRGPDAESAEVSTPRVWLGVENVFGFSSLTQTTQFDDGTGTQIESELEVSQFSLIGGGTGNPYAVPRFGIDFRLGRVFTLGGAFNVASGTVSTPVPGAPGTADPKAAMFGLQGRVGLLLGSGRFKVWPRLGLASFSQTLEAGDVEATTTGGAFSLEVPLVFHGSVFGVAFGPAFYVPTGGSFEMEDAASNRVAGDVSVRGWTLNVGAVALF